MTAIPDQVTEPTPSQTPDARRPFAVTVAAMTLLITSVTIIAVAIILCGLYLYNLLRASGVNEETYLLIALAITLCALGLWNMSRALFRMAPHARAGALRMCIIAALVVGLALWKYLEFSYVSQPLQLRAAVGHHPDLSLLYYYGVGAVGYLALIAHLLTRPHVIAAFHTTPLDPASHQQH